MKYIKSPLTYQEQISLLKSRGLFLANEVKTISILKNISYYRLSAYFLPSQNEKDKFNDNVEFNDILRLYDFDKHFRILMLEAVKTIEISLRTHITYYLSHKYGAFGYLNSENFSSKFFDYKDWLLKSKKTIEKSKETFIRHYKKKYVAMNDLPIWMFTEVISFSQLSWMFRGLKGEDGKAIAKEIYGIHFNMLASWIHVLAYIRNICAHHSRLWNRKLAIEPKIPKQNKEWNKINNRKVFCVLLILKNMFKLENQWIDWRDRLILILQESNFINKKTMGFPDHWEKLLKGSKSTPLIPSVYAIKK